MINGPSALCVIDRDGERALGGPHRRVAEIGRVERHEPRRRGHEEYRPIGPLQQADAGARPDPACRHRLRGTMRQTRNVGRRESAETLGLGQRGYGTKCMTMPLANHIANSNASGMPSQRCRQHQRTHHQLSVTT